MSEAIERRMIELRELAVRFSEAFARRGYLEEFRKTKKALLMQEAETKGQKAIGTQERDAYAHPDYLQLLKDLEAAVAESERLRWELEIVKMHFGAWQTKSANERAERKGYGA